MSKPLSVPMPNRSIGIKLILVCVLVVLMAVPAMFISYISFERSNRANDVTREVSERYGGQQFISGPLLIVPYFRADGENRVVETGQFVISPEEGDVEFEEIKTEIKKRSLFKVPIYHASGSLSAKFSPIIPSKFDPSRVYNWDKARIVISLTDGRGLTEDLHLKLSTGETRKFEPDSYSPSMALVSAFDKAELSYAAAPAIQRNNGLNGQVLSVPIGDLLSESQGLEMSTHLHIGGAERLGVYPFAKSTIVTMRSDWASPGFQGGFAPVEREISDNGFSARWSVPYLARGIRANAPAHQLGLFNPNEKAMTVQFVAEVNPYQTVNRALKYAVMFIGLVFITFFLFEVLVGTPVHAAQYILIGLAQSIFYLLLLAFSEHIGFTPSFIIAASATIILTGFYAGAVFGGKAYAVRAGLVFAVTYSLLFVLMRLQDFALLIGALASFTAIALIMYLTRNIDWYGGDRISRSSSTSKPEAFT